MTLATSDRHPRQVPTLLSRRPPGVWLRGAVGLAGAILATAILGVSPAAAAGGLRQITVDASKPIGIIRSLQGVSGTPLPGDSSHADLTAQFRQLGVNIVRTHDVDCNGTSDIDGLGPNRIFPSWSANPNDPSSYNFGPTDRAILSIVRSGAQVEYSVGHSDLTCAGIAFNNTPPPDPALYAAVVRHVAEHYNDGWDNGYQLRIRYWEIWNEPDLVPFWSGTSAQYYALYADTARALKSLHPWMEVGGPALTTNNDLTGYRESLLAYIRANHVPLDFYSIHHYSDFTEDPLDFVRLADQYRQLLDSYGFTHTQVQLTEWNYGLVDNPSDAQRAAFAADSLVYMQDAPLDRAFFYRANSNGAFNGALINSDGTLTKTGDAYEAVGSMEGTPLRLATTGGDQDGLAVEAGRSWGARGQVNVLISNYEIPAADQGPFPDPPIVNDLFTIPGIGAFTLLPRRSVTYANNDGYDLAVNRIPDGRSGVVVTRYRIDDSDNLTLVDRSLQRGPSVHVSAALPAPSVELVVISGLHRDDR
jgi:xylan 1,4-beta-xylosidase